MADKMVDGFASLDEVADMIAEFNPHRPRPADLDGLRNNLRRRGDRWYWHWDPAFLTAPDDDPFVRVELLEQAAVELTIEVVDAAGHRFEVTAVKGRAIREIKLSS